jgi:lipopolysaccharide export system protein LptA
MKNIILYLLLYIPWTWSGDPSTAVGFKIYVDNVVVKKVPITVNATEIAIYDPGTHAINITAYGNNWETKKSTTRYVTVK